MQFVSKEIDHNILKGETDQAENLIAVNQLKGAVKCSLAQLLDIKVSGIYILDCYSVISIDRLYNKKFPFFKN
jgi:hypothetical protein